MRMRRQDFSSYPPLFLALVLLSFWPISRLIPSASAQPTPLWWEISLNIKTEGDYNVTGVDSGWKGNYSFIVRWTGCLEKDDQDYLLYHIDSRLSDWKARETGSSPEAITLLTESDFKERPCFELEYILRRDLDLCLDFLVKGIVVPQSSPEEGFPLFFPSSEENKQRDFLVDYNACVVGGSNRVSFKEAEIYAGPITKNYAWTWKHQHWQIRHNRPVFTAQSHRANVSLSITPRYSRPK